ncbi:heme ABC transporter ATP-binding protein/permease CydC [Shewanella amazonensis]|uniref:ABC transporter, ATP-binding protein CydC n=1 Tax=Shewanella amazonensis (strain ATCC BAA-1098 / SB2B) TaxID=326297 RepID=A1S924_SHEAM|nr:cysteine/glutathione ABC transporter ATP-binding protein/permease CydC [Shewanella amazonensis]ABM00881.1 ABC transporter, ATP-binding protein CydC [Shewanella amazonensis SB2B]
MNLIKLFLPLLRRQWLMMFTGLLLAFITLVAGIGLLSLSGWFLSATAVAGLSLATAQAFNFFTPAGGVRFLSIARTASRYGERLATHEATFRLLTELRVKVWRALMPLADKDLAGLRQSELLNRLVADIDTLDHLYLRLLVPMGAFVGVLLALFAFIGWFDARLSLLLCGGLLLALCCIPLSFYLLGRSSAVAVVNEKRRYRVQSLEFLGGLAELWLFGALDKYRQDLNATERQWQDSQRAMAGLQGLSQAVLVMVHGVLIVLMLVMASSGVGDRVPPGPLAAMVLFASLAVMEMLMPLAGAFSQLAGCLAAGDRVNDITGKQSTIAFGDKTQLPAGDIIFENIEFGYQAQDPVLSRFSLHIRRGSRVAVLGKTGVGKSSLFTLLTRGYNPDAGRIRVGDTDIQEVTEKALRSAITVVSQRVHLFAGTLKDNLAMACETLPTDAALIQVLERVGLGYLAQSDDGLKLWIGEGGRLLSGGETRRIGIARALLKDSPILLLDEPTEGLDRRTERQMLALLFEHAKDKTLVMISHRLTAMTEMDAIHILENGRVRASGSHETLVAQHPEYRALSLSRE